MLLIISVQELMDRPGHHLSSRIGTLSSARDRSVHCRRRAGPVIPRDQTEISAEAQQQMPKVLETVVTEEDKVESSQTKSRGVQSQPCCAPGKGARCVRRC